MINRLYPFFAVLFFAAVMMAGCNGSGESKNKTTPNNDTVKATPAKEEVKVEPQPEYQRPPIVNIVDTLTPKRTIIYCKDSAFNFERVGPKRVKIYEGKLADYIKKNSLKKAGAPMTWYRKLRAPYFFEAGIPVNKRGNKPVNGVLIREQVAGKAIVAHFYGPFELLPQGYDAIKEYMKEHKKVAAGAPYEIYLTDTIDKKGKPVDPYKIQTDIVFPIR